MFLRTPLLPHGAHLTFLLHCEPLSAQSGEGGGGGGGWGLGEGGGEWEGA